MPNGYLQATGENSWELYSNTFGGTKLEFFFISLWALQDLIQPLPKSTFPSPHI